MTLHIVPLVVENLDALLTIADAQLDLRGLLLGTDHLIVHILIVSEPLHKLVAKFDRNRLSDIMDYDVLNGLRIILYFDLAAVPHAVKQTGSELRILEIIGHKYLVRVQCSLTRVRARYPEVR